MGKYISENLKTAFLSKYSRIYIGVILFLCLAANIAVMAFRMVYGSNEGTFAYNIIEYATWCFFIPYYSCIFIADIVFITCRKGKNELSLTASYLARLITSVLLALIFLVITFILLIAVTSLFHLNDGTFKFYAVKDFIGKLIIAIPLWLAGMGIGNMFLSVCSKKKYAYIGYFALCIVFERTVMFFAAEPFKIDIFVKIRTIVITQLFSLIPYPANPARNVPLTVFLGFFYLVLFTVIGILVSRNKAGRNIDE